MKGEGKWLKRGRLNWEIGKRGIEDALGKYSELGLGGWRGGGVQTRDILVMMLLRGRGEGKRGRRG